MKRVFTPKTWLSEWAVTVAYVLVIAVATVVFLRYSFGGFMAMFNSDASANVLFANEMIAQRTPFPQWNDSTWIFFPLIIPNLAVMPLVLAFVGDWFTAFRIATAIDQVIMFGLMAWVLGRGGLSRAGRLFLIAFLLIGPSIPFVGQTTLLAFKSWVYVFILLLGYFAWRVADVATSRERWRWLALLIGIGALIFTDLANAATIVPGLGAGLAAQWLAGTDRRSRAGCLTAMAALLAACVLGQLIDHGLLTSSHYKPFELGFTDLTEAGGHFELFARGMIELFGGVPPVGASPYSIRGMASGAKFVLLLAVLLAPVYFALRHDLLRNRFARLLAVACSVSLAVRLYVYLFTGISVGITGTARYFIVEILLGLTLCLFYLEQRVRERGVRELLVLALIAPFALTSPLWGVSMGAPTKDQVLARELEAHGLTFGYATFWNANAPTAISSGRIRVRQVEFANATITPYRWLSSDRWYEGDPAATESFLLLDAQELKNADLSALRAVVGEPVRSVEIAPGYTALVYPFDLAVRLGWAGALNRAAPAG